MLKDEIGPYKLSAASCFLPASKLVTQRNAETLRVLFVIDNIKELNLGNGYQFETVRSPCQ
jgi:hypothetical protein